MQSHLRPCGRSFLLAAVLIAAGIAPCSAQQPGATRTITGRVVDSLVQPLPGATVTLGPTGRVVRTDSTGTFRFLGVESGSHTITVQQLGYLPVSDTLAFDAGSAAFRTITLARVATTLPTVNTRAVGEFGKPARLAYTMKYDEFYQRRSQSAGSGLFYTHEDLVKMGVQDFPDMLRRVPNLRLNQNPDGTTLTFPGCGTDHILIKLDDQRVWPSDSIMMSSGMGKALVPPDLRRSPTSGQGEGEDPLELIASLHLQNVEAMEVYKDVASLPMDAIGEICGAIYIWTR